MSATIERRLTDAQRQQIEELWPMVHEIVRYHTRKLHRDFDEIESSAQWGLIWAVMNYDSDDGETLTRFARKAINYCSKYLPIKARNVWGFGVSDDFMYDPEDTRSRLAFNTLESELDLAELQRTMAPDEWTVVRIVVMDGLPISEVTAFLKITVNRAVELYTSAAEKIRAWYEEPPSNP